MKKIQTLMLAASTLFAVQSFAQASATATASGTIVAPLSITKTVDMNFGIAAQSNTPGWVQLSPAGTRTTTGGALFLPEAGTVTAATFTVAGEGNYTYAITLPVSLALTNTTGTGGETMTVANFNSLPTVATGGTLATGTQTLTVGAELAIGANQVSGVYLSGTPFTVTVNYN